MSEAKFYSNYQKGLRTNKNCDIKINRVENTLVPGYPDVTYSIYNKKHKTGTHGFIENKSVRLNKLNVSAIFTINHFTPEQRVFLYQSYNLVGQGVFLFIKIAITNNKDIYLLLNGKVAQKVNNASFSELVNECVIYNEGNINYNYLVDSLTFR